MDQFYQYAVTFVNKKLFYDSNKKICILCLLLTGFFYLNATSQYNLTDAIPTDPNVKVGKLANGLTYYISKNAKPERKQNSAWW